MERTRDTIHLNDAALDVLREYAIRRADMDLGGSMEFCPFPHREVELVAKIYMVSKDEVLKAMGIFGNDRTKFDAYCNVVRNEMLTGEVE